MAHQPAQSFQNPGAVGILTSPNAGVYGERDRILRLLFLEAEVRRVMVSLTAEISRSERQLNETRSLTSSNLYRTAGTLGQFQAGVRYGGPTPPTSTGFPSQHLPNHLTAISRLEGEFDYSYGGEQYSSFSRDHGSPAVPPSTGQHNCILDLPNHDGNPNLSGFEYGTQGTTSDTIHDPLVPSPPNNYGNGFCQMSLDYPSTIPDLSPDSAWAFDSRSQSQTLVQCGSSQDTHTVELSSNGLQTLAVRSPVPSAECFMQIDGGSATPSLPPGIPPPLLVAEGNSGVSHEPNAGNLAYCKDRFGYGLPSVVFQRLTKDGIRISTSALDRLLYPVGQRSIKTRKRGRKCRAQARLTRDGPTQWDHLDEPCNKEFNNIDAYRRHTLYIHLGCTRRPGQSQLEMLQQRSYEAEG